MSFKMVDERKPNKPKELNNRRRRYGHVRRINDYSKYKQVRPEKVEEIKAVWDSPNFKTNNQRLVYLFRHCHNIEYGYTIREFAHARFPEKMTPEPKNNDDYLWGEYYAFKALHMMFNRFRHDELNHEVLLAAIYKKLQKETVGRWYYYNIIDDDKAIKEVKLRNERCVLGLERKMQDLKGIAEMSEEDWNILHDRRIKEIQAKTRSFKKGKRRKK